MVNIAPILVACKERYIKLASISLPSYAKHHNTPLFVVTDSKRELKKHKSSVIRIINIDKYLKEIFTETDIPAFSHYDYEKPGDYDRQFASLKPLIMEKVIADLAPETDYILSLDVDTYFSGEIMNKVQAEINRDHKDIYMVARVDGRMLRTRSLMPGSGFTLWSRKSKFIKYFRQGVAAGNAKDGSQSLIHQIRGRLSQRIITDAMLHFVSPDLNNPNFPDSEIRKLKPAYIHLHGRNSYNRLLKFKRILENV